MGVSDRQTDGYRRTDTYRSRQTCTEVGRQTDKAKVIYFFLNFTDTKTNRQDKH